MNKSFLNAIKNNNLEVVKELLKDPRVDWRKMSNHMKTSILKKSALFFFYAKLT